MPKLAILLMVAAAVLLEPGPRAASGNPSEAPAAAPGEPLLTRAVVCEGIQELEPLHPGVVFSIEVGKVACFTSFENISGRTAIFHNWYLRDKPSARTRLILQPPRWSAFSTIHLREGDKGPWRVEITTAEGGVLKVLRFSITD